MATQPGNWEAVKALFEAALEEDAANRSSFLKERCPHASVCAEVERLLAEHDEAASFLSTPALGNVPSETDIPAARLSEGEVLAGRFRIIRFIATGGMGEVYEAEDQELREHVAVKTIRPEILVQPNAIARFKREVHLARQVTHPNVCRIFDLFRHKPDGGNVREGVVFISMELLCGKTLSVRLKEGGRMSVGEALPLVGQMASALAAAHEVGIIHCDFKPGNVVLVGTPERWRAVVTDFGLALRSVTSDETASLPSGQGLLGTPAYMSPEQIEGRPATTASDIYALGLVIYEMVTGQRPFRGDTPMSAAIKRLSETAISPRKIQPRLSPVWEAVIGRCLERDPERRFAGAAEVANALEAGLAGATVFPRSTRRTLLALAFILLLLVAIAAAGFRYSRAHRDRGLDETTSKITPRRSIAVLGFKNLSGRSELNWISTALSEELTDELAAGEQLRTVPGENVARLKADLSLPQTDSLGNETLSKIHRALGSEIVVLGSYLDIGSRLRVDLRLQNAVTGETIATVSDSENEDQILDLIGRIGKVLRGKCGVGDLTSSQAEAVSAARAANPNAARLYAEGLEKLRSFDAVEARTLFEGAIASDEKYALAHSALAAAWSQLGYDSKANDEGRKAVDLSSNLSREDRLLVEARSDEATMHWDKAAGVYRALFTFFPDNVEYGVALAESQSRMGKNKDAAETIRSLRSLPLPLRDDLRIPIAEILVSGKAGDPAHVLGLADEVEKKAQLQGAKLLVARAKAMTCWSLSYLSRYAEALAPCQEAQRTYSAAGDQWGTAVTIQQIGFIAERTGFMNDAEKHYREALDMFREIGAQRNAATVLGLLANVLNLEGRESEAAQFGAQSLDVYRAIGNKPGAAFAQNTLAMILQSEGKLNEAESLKVRALSGFQEVSDHSNAAWVAGDLSSTLLLEGKLGEAQRIVLAAIADARESHAESYLAFILISAGDLSAVRDSANDARRNYTESLNIQEKNGEGGAIVSWMSLAQLSLDTGDSVSALNATRALKHDASGEDQVWVSAMFAQALLAQGKMQEAAQEIEASEGVASTCQNRIWAGRFVRARARVMGAEGHYEDALELLRANLLESRRMGCVFCQLETQLVAVELDLSVGKTVAAQSRARALLVEAKKREFLAIAKRCAALLSGA
jgi:serine/threonine protein kinase/tetratricopeptide (TPR) repeat protein